MAYPTYLDSTGATRSVKTASSSAAGSNADPDINSMIAAGTTAHDAVGTSTDPLLQGGYASATAPSDVSADGDAVRAWNLRNGSRAITITCAGALVGGDATNGLDVDVTRVPTDPFGANADAASATGSISAKLRFIAATGIPITGSVAVTNAGTFAVQAVCTNAGTFATQSVCTNAGTFAVQAAQSGTWNVTNVSGTVSLPTGASTAAKQPALGTAGTASTDVLTVQGIASMTPILTTLSGTNNIATVTTVTGVTTVSTVTAVTAITNALPAGTNSIGAVTQNAATSGGTSLPYSFLSTAAVQAAAIKASAGQVYALHFFNLNAAAVYVRLYDQTSSPGTGDTVVYRAIVPGNTAGAGFVVPIPPGVVFATGIGIRVTGAVADNDATALAANTVIGNVFYK